MTPILDLDDWALSLFADSTLLHSEPAFALETDGALSFGREAAAVARIHPRRVNHGFLSRLSADPLPQPFRAARNQADLFYHQLRALTAAHPLLTRDPVLVIVRGTTTADQLGLVLGVAGECGIRIGGFVDRSIAALASQGGMGERICIEFDSDHAEVSRARLGVDVVRINSNHFPGVGLNFIQDGWANVIADHFIRHSRFDPLHAAATEQQLYDSVRGWFNGGKVHTALAIEHQQEIRRVDLRMDALEEKLKERVEPLLQTLAARSSVCLGPNASATPLFASMLKKMGFQVHPVDRDGLLRYVEQHVSPLCNPDEVRFYTTLPAALPPALATFTPSPPVPVRPASAEASPGAHAAARVTSRPGQPTHGLHGAVAYPIGSTDLPLTAAGENPQCGVTIDVNGRLFTLIEVRP
jgi:hypothetical protein